MKVLGEVTGDVSVIDGQLRVAGTITGDTSMVGGGVILDEKGTINGKRAAEAGPKPGSELEKEKENENEKEEEEEEEEEKEEENVMNFDFNGHPVACLLTDGDDSHWVWVAALCVGLMLMVCWGASSILVTLIAPRALDEAARLFTRSGRRVWAVGVAFWLVFSVACGIALILSSIYVGVPMLGGLALIFFAMRWFGLAALMLWFGRRICLAVRGHEPSLPSALMIGLLALGLLHMVPIAGVALWLLLLIPVAGVAVLWVLEARSSSPSTPPPPVAPVTPPEPAATSQTG